MKETKLTSKIIIEIMMTSRWRKHTTISNYSPPNWMECDLFELTKSGYGREYEIKISRSDFFADADKIHYSGKKKHEMLANGHKWCPNNFWFVTPAGLISPSEVPPWAGLIEITQIGRRLVENEVVQSPRIRNVPMGDETMNHMFRNCYWRMHGLIRSKKPHDTLLEDGDGI